MVIDYFGTMANAIEYYERHWGRRACYTQMETYIRINLY